LSKIHPLGGRSREPDKSARLVLHAPPSGGSFREIRAAVRNAIYSGTRIGYAGSGHRPGRSGLLACRFAQSQKVSLSEQLADPQNDYVLRPGLG